MAKNYLEKTRWLGLLVGSWVFPGKKKRKKVGVCLTVIGRGNMQIANTRDTVSGERYTDYEA